MSGLLISSNRDLNVPWANELMILKPYHPEVIRNQDEKSSYVTSFITVYFAGATEYSRLTEEAKWELGIVHRGNIDGEQVCQSLNFCNASLGANDKKFSFLNQVLSRVPEKREISAASGKQPRVYLFLKDILREKKIVDVYNLDKAKVYTEYLQPINCTIIKIKGTGLEPRVFRISYNHRIPVLPIDNQKKLTYKINDFLGASIEQDFEIHSYRKALSDIEDEIKKTNRKEELEELFIEKIKRQLISPQELSLDLTIMGDPSAFRYEFRESHLTTVDTLVNGIDWVGLNGQPCEPIRTTVYSIFPKKSYHNNPQPFEMHVRARLSCNVCMDIFNNKFLDKIEEKVRNVVSEELKKVTLGNR
jgi:hypothetical protein